MNVITLYVVNNEDKTNPNENHEVHTIEHAITLKIKDYTSLGFHKDGKEALIKAKEKYDDANGCKDCCPEAHTE